MTEKDEELCVLMEVGCFGDMPIDPTVIKTKKKKTLEQIIAEVNKKLQPYARISRTTILDAPLEMTTTKKVKRTYTK